MPSSCLVNGNYSQWTPWSKCDDKFEVNRTRTCEDALHGGQCDGPDKEIKKCGKKVEPSDLTSISI